ncbi:MAG: nucleoside deaminase [Oscillospiraceae bacterium]|nr:nucleoside deaminase [Oscillospiraceae bacterium]
MNNTPEFYMQYALKLAEQAFSIGEVPVGAVIVRRSTGEIVGEGYNQREIRRHALSHAELLAIDSACRYLGGWRLPDCAMYVTLEPCLMCAGAILQARIEEVWFGAYDVKNGAVSSLIQAFALPNQYRTIAQGGILQEDCSALLSSFFRELRIKKQTSPKK